MKEEGGDRGMTVTHILIGMLNSNPITTIFK